MHQEEAGHPPALVYNHIGVLEDEEQHEDRIDGEEDLEDERQDGGAFPEMGFVVGEENHLIGDGQHGVD